MGGIPEIKVTISQFEQIHGIDVYTVWKEFGNLNPCAHGFKSVTAPKAGAILGVTFYQLI